MSLRVVDAMLPITAPVSFKIVLKIVDKKIIQTRIRVGNVYSKNLVHETCLQIHKNMDLST